MTSLMVIGFGQPTDPLLAPCRPIGSALSRLVLVIKLILCVPVVALSLPTTTCVMAQSRSSKPILAPASTVPSKTSFPAAPA